FAGVSSHLGGPPWAAVRCLPAFLGLLLREILMLVLTDRVRDTKTLPASLFQFTQMVDRRLAIAEKGLAEAQRHLAAGQKEDADLVLEKIDEDLHLLRCRLSREVERTASRP